MVKMIDVPSREDKSVAAFYDSLAPDYDQMTTFEKRFVHEKPFFRLLVEKFNIKSAVDAGCGTGFHSLLLAQLGVKVTAVDISHEMLDRLQAHATEMNLSVKILRSNFQELHNSITNSNDAVFCLGNSLAHILSEKELSDSLHSFAKVLKPDGILFIQNLNYDRILAQQDRIQSVKESEGKIFVRFYDYGENSIHFNILTLEKRHDTIVPSLKTVKLNPLRQADMRRLLSDAGYPEIKFFGGISMDEFNPDTSKDLVVLAKKSS
jgi:2-polyprenyl-3-methyl-5-hydroxy-6-metoxy-1,4-benzoquinol methylase